MKVYGMKRLFCALLILCLLPVCACALDLYEFNVFASVVGVDELDESAGKTAGKYTGFVKDDCHIYFVESDGKLTNIFIEGKGDNFISYCCAAIHVFDVNGNKTSNHGQFLTMYLIAHTQEGHQTGQTSNGYYFFIEPSEKGFTFMIGES